MQSTLALLTLSHPEAMPLIVQDALVPGVNVSDLVVNPPLPGAGLEMTAGIYISASAYNNPHWPYFGNVALTYTRLDMGDALGHIPFVFAFDPPFTSQQVADRMAEALGIKLDTIDVFQEVHDFTGTRYVMQLKAGPMSLRWMGQVEIEIRRLHSPINVYELTLPGIPDPSQIASTMDGLVVNPFMIHTLADLELPNVTFPPTLNGFDVANLVGVSDLGGLDFSLSVTLNSLMDGYDPPSVP